MQSRECSKCGKVKPLEDFSRDKRGRWGRSSQCKACRKQYDHELHQKNKKKDNERASEWRKRNVERVQLTKRHWKQTHPEKIRIENAKRRALKANAEGSYDETEWLELCAKYGNKCLRCGRTDRKLTPDHVIPLSKGGTNWIWNIQPLCFFCNSGKKIRTDDYRYSHRFDEIASLVVLGVPEKEAQTEKVMNGERSFSQV